MDASKISIGKNAPEEVNVVIENPLGGVPVKYELDKDSGALFVDRFLHTTMFYPGNYGFIPHTLSGDGDPADVLVLGPIPVAPGCVMPVRPVGVLIMEDESGMDEKIIAVPTTKLFPSFEATQDYKDVPEITLQQIEHFFKHYKDLENNKWSKVVRWDNAATARQLIEEAIDRAEEDKKAA